MTESLISAPQSSISLILSPQIEWKLFNFYHLLNTSTWHDAFDANAYWPCADATR